VGGIHNKVKMEGGDDQDDDMVQDMVPGEHMPPPPQPKPKRRGNPNLNKQKRKFTNTLKRGGKGCDQKVSTFDYDPHRPDLADGPADINRQTRSILDPNPMVASYGTPKSPPKKKLKEMVTKTKSELARTKGLLGRAENKMGTLKEEVKLLQQQLREEKKVSNAMIADARDHANDAIKEAVRIMEAAQDMSRQVEEKMLNDHAAHRDAMSKERSQASKAISYAKNKGKEMLQKHIKGSGAVSSQQESKHDREMANMISKLEEQRDRLTGEREKWQMQLDEMRNAVMEEKAKRRATVQRQVDKAKAYEKQMDDILGEVMEANRELKDSLRYANRERRDALKQAERAKEDSRTRLEKLIDMRQKHADLGHRLEELMEQKQDQDRLLQRYVKLAEQTEAESDTAEPLEMKRQYMPGKRGGGRWSYEVVLLIIELLVIGTPPSAIPATIGTFYETLLRKTPEELPSVNFVRQCRTVTQVLCETMSACKLASADDWVQWVFDATSRRQTPFQASIITVMTDAGLDPVIVSSCIFLDDESSETTANSLVDKVRHYSHASHYHITYA
jgi:hypothetical protein